MLQARTGQLRRFSSRSGANHIAPPMPTSGERFWVGSEASTSDRTGSFKAGSRVIDLSWISLAALILVIVLSCTTSVNPGSCIPGAGLGDRGLPGSALGATIHRQPGARWFSHRSLPDPGGGDSALYPGSRQRHARPGRADSAAVLPGQRRDDPDRLLRPFPERLVNRSGKHRVGRLDCATGHGGCRAGEDLRLS